MSKAPKATQHPEKDLSGFGKKCYDNADKNNRGTGSAGEYPKNWDENSVGKPTKSQGK